MARGAGTRLTAVPRAGHSRPVSTIRLHVAADLAEGATVGLSAQQAHYVRNVMRLAAGETVLLFNGRDGEWRARIDGLGKGWCSLQLGERTRAQASSPDLWLVFAPIKRARIDFVAEKATEMGVCALIPVFTARTAMTRVNAERLRANAVEAAEQCGRLDVPDVRDSRKLGELMADWPAERRLLLCDETGSGPPMPEAVTGLPAGGPWAVMIGPEGGFAPDEVDALRKLPFVTGASLGPRILRADTAAIAALALWQAHLGDWRG